VQLAGKIEVSTYKILLRNKFNYKGKTDTKFLAHAAFLLDKAPVTADLLRDITGGILYNSNHPNGPIIHKVHFIHNIILYR
jgi:hypothetical protein